MTAIAIFLVSGTVVTLMELPGESLFAIAFTLLGTVSIGLLARNRWWRDVGFRPPYERRLLWLFWLPFVPVFGNLLDGVPVTDPVQIDSFFTMALLSSLVEETLFRGLMLRGAAADRHLAGCADLGGSVWWDAHPERAVDTQSRLRIAASGICRGDWVYVCGVGHTHRNDLAAGCRSLLHQLHRLHGSRWRRSSRAGGFPRCQSLPPSTWFCLACTAFTSALLTVERSPAEIVAVRPDIPKFAVFPSPQRAETPAAECERFIVRLRGLLPSIHLRCTVEPVRPLLIQADARHRPRSGIARTVLPLVSCSNSLMLFASRFRSVTNESRGIHKLSAVNLEVTRRFVEGLRAPRRRCF